MSKDYYFEATVKLFKGAYGTIDQISQDCDTINEAIRKTQETIARYEAEGRVVQEVKILCFSR